MPYRLRYQAHDLELPIGEFVVGRSTDCQLSVDDPLVSRRHAVLKTRRDGVVLQDLDSRNGVLVNGTKIVGERELLHGDRINIGNQEMVLQATAESRAVGSTTTEDVHRRATQTLGIPFVSDPQTAATSSKRVPSIPPIADPPTNTETSRSIQSLMLLGGVADKALALGKAEDAERLLVSLLSDVAVRARDGNLDTDTCESAARYAARLAGATNKAQWIEYVFDLYRNQRRVLPGPVVDELYTVVRKVKNIDLSGVRTYLDVLREQTPGFGPADRFLVQRIEGLERQIALK